MAEYNKTVDLDALLKASDSKTVDLDTNLMAQDAKTVDLDVILGLTIICGVINPESVCSVGILNIASINGVV